MKNPFLAPCMVSCAALVLLSATLSSSSAAPRTPGNVVITNSGDRFLPGYRVTVEPNGRLTAVSVPRRGQKAIHRSEKMISLNERRFFEDLLKAEPLESLPTGQSRAQNASGSGPQVIVRYQGRQSPNLRTATSTTGKVLYQDVKQILQVLRLPIPNQP